MSMTLEKDENRIKVLVPNSEATISAQIKNIKDRIDNIHNGNGLNINHSINDHISRCSKSPETFVNHNR